MHALDAVILQLVHAAVFILKFQALSGKLVFGAELRMRVRAPRTDNCDGWQLKISLVTSGFTFYTNTSEECTSNQSKSFFWSASASLSAGAT